MNLRSMTFVALLTVAMFSLGGAAEAKTQIVADTAGEHGSQGRKIDLRSVRVTQVGDRVSFVLKFRHPGRRRSGVALNSGGRRYTVGRGSVNRFNYSDGTATKTGEVRFRANRRVHTFSFNLAAIGDPKSLSWLAFGMMSHYVDDRVPNRGFKAFRIARTGREPLPVKVITFEGNRGSFGIDCFKQTACRGELSIKAGKTKLVKPRRYTVKAGGQKKVRLRLTKAGRKALGKDGRAEGLGILTAPDGDKVKFTAVLKRKRR